MNISIHHSETICNSLKKNNLYEILSESERNYIPSVLLAMFSSDYHGKTLDFEEYSDHHRTSISRFLRSETWYEMPLLLELAYFLACSATNKFHFLSGLSIIVHQIEKEQYSHLYDIAVSSKDKSSFLALAC